MSGPNAITTNGEPPRLTRRLVLHRGLESVVEIARSAEQLLLSSGVPGPDAMAIRLALTEAANNAVQYAPPGSPPAEVELSLEPGRVRILVIDHGPGFGLPKTSTLPEPDAENGRGLYLIRTIMDEVIYEPAATGNRLVLRKKLPGSGCAGV